MASHAEGIEAERLLPVARDGHHDQGPFDFVRLPAQPIGIEHNVQVRSGINAMPSAALSGIVCCIRCGCGCSDIFQGSSTNSALRVRDRA
jgi:hypothetical protein